MTRGDILFKMWNEKDNFNPPLQIKEILDFYDTPIEEETRMWYPEWPKDLPKRIPITSATKKYNIKKEIKQDIKILNDQLEWWLDLKHNAPNEITKVYCDLHLEDYQVKKENLLKKLRYVGIKFGNDDLVRARQAPISDFLKFNSAGFANCPFHGPERTNSFHKLPGKERGYCFSCQKRADLIDVIMEIHQCKLPEALKIILKKI